MYINNWEWCCTECQGMWSVERIEIKCWTLRNYVRICYMLYKLVPKAMLETRECGTSKDKIYNIQKILRNTMGAEKCTAEPPCVWQRRRPDNPHQLSYLLLKTSTLQTQDLWKSPDGVSQLSPENAVHLPTRSCMPLLYVLWTHSTMVCNTHFV